jgi:hypothetical protein
MTFRTRILPGLALLTLVVSALFAAAPALQAPPAFPHEKHAKVFPVCTACHAGVVEAGQSMFPSPSGCAACHDGTIQQRVTWQPRSGPRATNLRFTHDAHRLAAAAKDPADSALIRNCSACHTPTGTSRMAVQHTVVGQCLACHGLKTSHVDNPAAACATCHLRLTDAPTLTRADIAGFPRPLGHDAPDWVLGGHGKAAKGPGAPSTPFAVAGNCATCHSRDLCLTCHVNAPEVAPIRALGLDDRAPTYSTTQPVPATHAASTFIRTHGRQATRSTATCATCHTQESCMSCHVGTLPAPLKTLRAAGPGRSAGAHVVRKPPASHTGEFRTQHAADANARPATCETCHTRANCLSCHRPDGSRQVGYHPQGFITRHPSSAYTREANCADCHNPAQFCQSCHKVSGIVASGRIGPSGYHDAFRGFSLGHGQAARQSLESCASCHAERDCTACHSAVGGGFRFSPHGPGFDAERMRAKNPSVCIACHGRVIPRGR